MRAEDVHGELGEIVTGRKPGRTSAADVIVFDSTGTALQDVAAAVPAPVTSGYSSLATPPAISVAVRQNDGNISAPAVRVTLGVTAAQHRRREAAVLEVADRGSARASRAPLLTISLTRRAP